MFTRGFMLDTSAINRIHDWQQCPWSLRGPLYVTDIQLQELSHTPDPDRRASLLSLGRVMPLIAASMGLRVEKYFPDALIAEAALTSNLTLVTADRRLAKVGRSFGAHVEEIPRTSSV